MRQARRRFERIAEEAIAPHELADVDDPFHAPLGRCCLRHEALLDEGSAVSWTSPDFSPKPTHRPKTMQSLSASAPASTT